MSFKKIRLKYWERFSGAAERFSADFDSHLGLAAILEFAEKS